MLLHWSWSCLLINCFRNDIDKIIWRISPAVYLCPVTYQRPLWDGLSGGREQKESSQCLAPYSFESWPS